jgi:serine/threonine protein kinase
MGSSQSQAEVDDAHQNGVIIAVAEDIPEGNEDDEMLLTGGAPPNAPPLADGATTGADLTRAIQQDYLDEVRRSSMGEPCDLPFKLGRTLGTGAFGKVKLGVHHQTGERVAVKIVPREKLLDKRLQANMAREIKMMKLLRNPHIVRLYDVVVARTKIYLAMEYGDGGDMLSYVNSRKPLSEPEAAAIFAQVIDGVGFCHRLGVCHRDLKLENLLLCNGAVKIADFGLANYAPPPTMDQAAFMETHCGSPLYAAPELLRNTAAYDATAVDVWSLGVVLFALVTKKLPFEGDGLPAILKKIVAGEYATPPHLSPQVVDLIGRMLTVDPAARASIDEIERHEWIRVHTAKAEECPIERSTSLRELTDEFRELGTGGPGSAAAGEGPAAEETRRRPTTMSSADIKREIALARGEAAAQSRPS